MCEQRWSFPVSILSCWCLLKLFMLCGLRAWQFANQIRCPSVGKGGVDLNCSIKLWPVPGSRQPLHVSRAGACQELPKFGWSPKLPTQNHQESNMQPKIIKNVWNRRFMSFQYPVACGFCTSWELERPEMSSLVDKPAATFVIPKHSYPKKGELVKQQLVLGRYQSRFGVSLPNMLLFFFLWCPLSAVPFNQTLHNKFDKITCEPNEHHRDWRASKIWTTWSEPTAEVFCFTFIHLQNQLQNLAAIQPLIIELLSIHHGTILKPL